MQQLIFSLLIFFRFKNSENKAVYFDEIRSGIYHPSQSRGEMGLFNMSFTYYRKKYPKLINVEKCFKVNGLRKKIRMLAVQRWSNSYPNRMQSPGSKISKATFDQIAHTYDTGMQTI
jgi:hypothetical protein